MSYSRGALLLAGCLGLWSAPGSAQELRSLSLVADNDGLTFWRPPAQRTDWYYTHGLRADADVEGIPWWLGRALGNPSGSRASLTRLTLGQQIYTPLHLFTPVPEPGDRPYAGWLYVELEGQVGNSGDERALGFQIGVTGTPSLGRQTHLAVHRWLGKAAPAGWENELPTELAFGASYRETRRWSVTLGPEALSVGVEHFWLTRLGTVRTAAESGLAVSIGLNGPDGLDWRGRPAGGFYLLASFGLEAELVLRDLFLDGSTWTESLRVSKEPLLGRTRSRIRIGWRRVALEYGATRSTRQFTTQETRHSYGTIRLIVRG